MKLFGATTVFDVLRQDHDEVERLMEDILEAETGSECSRLFAELKAKLDAHAEAEEAAFYPRLQNEDETRQLVLEALTEHRLMKQMLGELERSEVDEEWRAKFRVLKSLVVNHVTIEERELMPLAKRVLDSEEARNLAGVIEQEERERLGESPVGV